MPEETPGRNRDRTEDQNPLHSMMDTIIQGARKTMESEKEKVRVGGGGAGGPAESPKQSGLVKAFTGSSPDIPDPWTLTKDLTLGAVGALLSAPQAAGGAVREFAEAPWWTPMGFPREVLKKLGRGAGELAERTDDLVLPMRPAAKAILMAERALGIETPVGDSAERTKGFLDKVLAPFDNYVKNAGERIEGHYESMLSQMSEEGRDIAIRNQEYVREHFQRPDHPLRKLAFDFGSGGMSLLQSVGLLLLTKSPTISAAAITSMEKFQDYHDLREKGFGSGAASSISTAKAIPNFIIEAFALDYFMKAKGPGKHFIRGMTEGAEEGLQSLWSEGFYHLMGLEKIKSFKDYILHAGYNATIGTILGYGGSKMLSGLGKNFGFDDDVEAVVNKHIQPRAERLGISLMEQAFRQIDKADIIEIFGENGDYEMLKKPDLGIRHKKLIEEYNLIPLGEKGGNLYLSNPIVEWHTNKPIIVPKNSISSDLLHKKTKESLHQIEAFRVLDDTRGPIAEKVLGVLAGNQRIMQNWHKLEKAKQMKKGIVGMHSGGPDMEGLFTGKVKKGISRMQREANQMIPKEMSTEEANKFVNKVVNMYMANTDANLETMGEQFADAYTGTIMTMAHEHKRFYGHDGMFTSKDYFKPMANVIADLEARFMIPGLKKGWKQYQNKTQRVAHYLSDRFENLFKNLNEELKNRKDLTPDQKEALKVDESWVTRNEEVENQIREWLFTQDVDVQNAIAKQMDPRTRRVAKALHDFLQGEVANEIRFLRFMKWKHNVLDTGLMSKYLKSKESLDTGMKEHRVRYKHVKSELGKDIKALEADIAKLQKSRSAQYKKAGWPESVKRVTHHKSVKDLSPGVRAFLTAADVRFDGAWEGLWQFTPIAGLGAEYTFATKEGATIDEIGDALRAKQSELIGTKKPGQDADTDLWQDAPNTVKQRIANLIQKQAKAETLLEEYKGAVAHAEMTGQDVVVRKPLKDSEIRKLRESTIPVLEYRIGQYTPRNAGKWSIIKKEKIVDDNGDPIRKDGKIQYNERIVRTYENSYEADQALKAAIKSKGEDTAKKLRPWYRVKQTTAGWEEMLEYNKFASAHGYDFESLQPDVQHFDFGTRKHYYMADMSDLEDLVDKEVDAMTSVPERIAGEDVPGSQPAVRTPSSVREANTRESIEEAKAMKGPLLSNLYVHAWKAGMMARMVTDTKALGGKFQAMYDPQNPYHDRKRFENDIASITRNLKNSMGFGEGLYEPLKWLEKANRIWWKGYALSPTKLAWFFTRNLLQPVALMKSRISSASMVSGVTRFLFDGDSRSRTLEAMNKYLRDRISQKGAIYKQYMMLEQEARHTKMGGRFRKAVNDIGQMMVWSDEFNRILSFCGYYPAIDKEVDAYVQQAKMGEKAEKKAWNRMSGRLMLENMKPADQKHFQDLINSNQFEEAKVILTDQKIADTQYKYRLGERTLMEQRRGTRQIAGLLVWPSNFASLIVNNGLRPLADGFRTGNLRKMRQGGATLISAIIGMTATKELAEYIVGKKGFGAYDALDTLFSWTMFNPGLATVADGVRTAMDSVGRLRKESADKITYNHPEVINYVRHVTSSLDVALVNVPVLHEIGIAMNTLRDEKGWTASKTLLHALGAELRSMGIEKVERAGYQKLHSAVFGSDQDPVVESPASYRYAKGEIDAGRLMRELFLWPPKEEEYTRKKLGGPKRKPSPPSPPSPPGK